MTITIETPALLFPTISLLFLSYTNKYLTLANLIRQLHKEYQVSQEKVVYWQIQLLQKRVNMIKNMQKFGIAALISSTISMIFYYFNLEFNLEAWGKLFFGLALLTLLISLLICFMEIRLSVKALNLRLKDLDQNQKIFQKDN